MLGPLEQNGKHLTPAPLIMTRLIGNQQKQENNKKHSSSSSSSSSNRCDDVCIDVCCGCNMYGPNQGLLCLLFSTLCSDDCCSEAL